LLATILITPHGWWDQQDGTGRSARNPRGDASEEEALQQSPPVGTEYDKIGREISQQPQDLVGRALPPANILPNLQVCAAFDPCARLLHLPANFRSDPVQLHPEVRNVQSFGENV